MRYLLPLLLPALAFAGWSEFKAGPFQVVSERGDKEARITLNYLEQLRHALGSALGQQDMQSVWPIRIVLRKGKQAAYPAPKFGRDAWIASIDKMNPQTVAGVTEILLDSWQGHVPPNIRRGLITLYSTLDVDATRVYLGDPPAQKDRDWSRAHMLAVDPKFSGKLRVLLANIGKGIEPDVAYKNAFERTAHEIELAVNSYIEAGQYGTIPVSGKPINAERQFYAKDFADKDAAVAMADLAFANGADPGYEKLGLTEGEGLVALRKGDAEAARKQLASATGAYALVEYAKLLPEEQRKPVLEKAAAANPKWGLPHKLLADVETHPAQRLAALRKTTQLSPNDTAAWISLAETQEAAKQLAEASKSWAAAERITDDLEERERIRQSRVKGQQARAEAEMAKREEAQRKAEQEMQDLKNRALMDIRRAEAKANAGKPVIDSSKLDEYKDEPKTKMIEGLLSRVDCQGSQATLHVLKGKSVTRLLVADPSSVAISGGERAFSCGAQRPARQVEVEYEPGTDKRVTRIEFR